MPRETGNVKWFSGEKGYGFIQRDGEEDVFVHHSEIAMDGFRTLDAGEAVDFEITPGERGPKARDVHRKGMEATTPRTSGRGSANGPTDGRTGGGQNGSLTLVEKIKRKLGGRFFH